MILTLVFTAVAFPILSFLMPKATHGKECQDVLGMQSGAISDEQLSASSTYYGFNVTEGRLYSSRGWAAGSSDVNQWFQVDLRSPYMKVTRVATQGRNNHFQCVRKYKLQYSDNGVTFQHYKERGQSKIKEFTANTDGNTVVYQELDPPITAQFIRLLPLTWIDHITMRMELYGCKESIMLKPAQRAYPRRQTFRSHSFIKDAFHHLNVPTVGNFTVDDVMNCIFECLTHSLCFALNLAAYKGADGKLWCELLSADKYSNPKEYRLHDSLHHYSMESPCSSSPCQNGGTCLANYIRNKFECICEGPFDGDYCERIVFKSCKEVYEVLRQNISLVKTLNFDSPVSVLCHLGDFGCGDGGWTPVMKINGNKSTFHYDSFYWSNKDAYNIPGGKTGFDLQETKLPTYWNTPFSKICLGMKIGEHIRFIAFNKTADSLFSFIAGGNYTATSLGRDIWKSLIGSQASLQINCNKEGFNVWIKNSDPKARIGLVADDQKDCPSSNSRIGFGTGGNHDDSNTCGNEAKWNPDSTTTSIKAMGYILVH